MAGARGNAVRSCDVVTVQSLSVLLARCIVDTAADTDQAIAEKGK